MWWGLLKVIMLQRGTDIFTIKPAILVASHLDACQLDCLTP